MKKLLIVFIIMILFNSMTFTAYGKYFAPLKRLPYTVEEAKTPLNSKEYSVYVEGKESDKKVTITEYINSRGTMVSLREIVEALGGTIEYNPEKYDPEKSNYRLGTFSLFGYNYQYYSSWDLSGSEDHDVEDYFLMTICMDYKGKNIGLSMGTMSSDTYGKFKNNKIYVQIDLLKAIMPRMGYISSVDKKTGIISVKKYDFYKERDTMLRKFPKEYLKKNICSSYFLQDEFVKVDSCYGDFRRGSYRCYDKYSEQYITSIDIAQRILQYIDKDFRYVYAISDNDTEFCENLIKVAYFDYFEDEDINIFYDNDLEAYIITNASSIDSIKYDKDLKLIVVRAADVMVLFKYLYLH